MTIALLSHLLNPATTRPIASLHTQSMDGNIAGPSKPFQVGGNQAGQGSGMGLSNNGNTGATSVYPPQPYGPASGQQSLPTPTRTSSPSNVSSNSNGKGKATDGSNSTNGSSRKRMASSSPGNEGSKEKRSRPEDGSGEGLGSSPSGKVGDMYGGAPTPDGRVWGEEATK